MPSSNSLGTQIEAALAPKYRIDPAGHTQKMLRYRTAPGIPIVRNTSGSAQFWFSANDRLKAAVETAGFRCEKNVPNTTPAKSSGSGRHSNLDAIREFKDQPLFWTTVATPGEAQIVAACLR